jgi:hypothetical protein
MQGWCFDYGQDEPFGYARGETLLDPSPIRCHSSPSTARTAIVRGPVAETAGRSGPSVAVATPLLVTVSCIFITPELR